MNVNHAGLQRAHAFANLHRQAKGSRPLYARHQNVGELYVYEQIGEDWWTGEGVTAKRVQEALAQLKGATTLNIYVNSEGGDIFEAKAIHSLIRRFVGERVVHIDGIAASAATFVAMAGDRIITAPSATWMIHEVWTRTAGRAQDLRATADVLDIENKTFAETYAARTGQKVEDVQAWMAAETWMDAKTAKSRGFTDEIAEAESSTGLAAANQRAALVAQARRYSDVWR